MQNVSTELIGKTKVPIVSESSVCWLQECSGGNVISDAARWYLETYETRNQSWKDSIAGTVWHSGAMLGTIPGYFHYLDQQFHS